MLNPRLHGLHGPHVARTIPVSTTSSALILSVLLCAPGHVARDCGMISSHIRRTTGITRSIFPPNHSNTAGALNVPRYPRLAGWGLNEPPLTDYLHFRPFPGLIRWRKINRADAKLEKGFALTATTTTGTTGRSIQRQLQAYESTAGLSSILRNRY
ncbi:uncharacterized protein M421DRAFT_219525 [Didymella exigua CBS 183.55]|uniref:Uncharacterized protein n=1 Tax=Didymella exigua CBS 183.55 TaxID=1150837 RepID=A0A6A5RG26_9PLEO|nr:uncharacterized protein M421DRAFT_219525 [Didymella exigua CBS 183.55]KAF1926220.1 hypothetical protein M421DRAFT_219525 [Didymella exigua CBS 183.55]